MQYKEVSLREKLKMDREEIIADNLFILAKYVIEKRDIKNISSLHFLIGKDMSYKVYAVFPSGEEIDLKVESEVDYSVEKMSDARHEIQLLLCVSDLNKVRDKLLEKSLNEL